MPLHGPEEWGFENPKKCPIYGDIRILALFLKFATFHILVQYLSPTRSVAKNLDLMESNKSNKSTFWQWSRKCDLLLTFFNLTEASLL
jgi:hypothetical protein